MRDPQREYQIARAVWLYQRCGRALELRRVGTNGLKAQALGQRLARWLTGADAYQRAEYYRRICALDGRETTGSRVSRRRGKQVLRSIPAEEWAEQYRRHEE